MVGQAARRPHAAKRGRARPRRARLPVRRPARHRQDVDGQDPGQVDQLRAGADGHALPGVRVVPQRSTTPPSIDVIEMDAASHRGIDDIREIRDRVALRPARGRMKVYIVDEAHMLTKEASNAVLKTLEEPPDHVVFVLCTTEMQAMLPTIRSRCQRFAFQRPGLPEISEVLHRIAAAETIEIDDAAVQLVARAAGGSFRDARHHRSTSWRPRRSDADRRRRRARAAGHAPTRPSLFGADRPGGGRRRRRARCVQSTSWPRPAPTWPRSRPACSATCGRCS